jgi:hypothetical protein
LSSRAPKDIKCFSAPSEAMIKSPAADTFIGHKGEEDGVDSIYLLKEDL